MSRNKTDWSKPNPYFPDIKLGVGYGTDPTRKGDFRKYHEEPLSVIDWKYKNGNNRPIGAFNDPNYY